MPSIRVIRAIGGCHPRPSVIMALHQNQSRRQPAGRQRSQPGTFAPAAN